MYGLKINIVNFIGTIYLSLESFRRQNRRNPKWETLLSVAEAKSGAIAGKVAKNTVLGRALKEDNARIRVLKYTKGLRLRVCPSRTQS